MYDKEINLKKSSTSANRYWYFYDPQHPLAMSDGRVYFHRHVASLREGRWLERWDHVHHLNGDIDNNDPSNLVILTNSNHVKIHNPVKDNKIYKLCPTCDNGFSTSRLEAVFCSYRCAQVGSRKFDISKDKLQQLVWSAPTSRVADMLGVSDAAIAKRCKKLGISKPARGYWAKQRKMGE